jgi:C3HC zinc finger-like
MDTLKCCVCQEVVAFTASSKLHGRAANEAAAPFLASLEDKHSRSCPWRGPHEVATKVLAFPPADGSLVCKTLAHRVANLASVSALPALGGSGLATLCREALGQVIALLRAAAVPARVRLCINLTANFVPVSANIAPVSAPCEPQRSRQTRLITTQQNLCSQDGCSDDDESAAPERHSFAALSRRPRAFSQAAKVLALLGWAVIPLPGKATDADGLHSMGDCIAKCSVCGAVAGLWAYEPGPGTQGLLGCHGLIGEWGAGLEQAPATLRSISIAGGLDNPTQTRPEGPMPQGPADTPPPPANADEPGHSGQGASLRTFGSLGTEPIFGVAVIQSERQSASPAPALTGTAKAAAVVGRKHRREGSDAADVLAKVARILAAEDTNALSEAAERQLSAAGLSLALRKGSAGAFDPVLSHRGWCARAWLPAGRSAVRLLFNSAGRLHLAAAVRCFVDNAACMCSWMAERKYIVVLIIIFFWWPLSAYLASRVAYFSGSRPL